MKPILLGLLSAATLICQDLHAVRAEPDLEKRSEKALLHAEKVMDGLRKLYDAGEWKPVVAALNEVEQGATLARESLQKSGKNPRRSPKYFKRAELKLRTLTRRLDSAAHVVSIDERPDVLRVKDIADLVSRVLTVTGVLRTGGALVLAVIGLIVLFIIVNTIRLAVVARAEEIEIMRLVGASDAFIRWPFIFEGALVGLLAAIITMAVLLGASEPIARFMFDFFRVLPLRVESIARDVGLLVVLTGVGLGVVGSWLSVRTYLLR